jgi:hypothetical protein
MTSPVASWRSVIHSCSSFGVQLIALQPICAKPAKQPQPTCCRSHWLPVCPQRLGDRLIAETWRNLMALLGSHEPNAPLAQLYI